MRQNQFLIFVILLLLGIYTFAQSFMKIDYGNITPLIAGGAFLLLYYNKRQTWALFLGCFALFIFSTNMLKMLPINSGVTGALFFIFLGAAFLISYYNRNGRISLYTGSMLVWFGIYLLISKIDILHGNESAFLYVCAGMFLATLFYCNRIKWYLYISILLIVHGIFKFAGLSLFSIIFKDIFFILIVIALWGLLKRRR